MGASEDREIRFVESVCDTIALAQKNARDEGYAECQRDVETLLSKGRTPGGEAITSARHAAEVIKRGDHVGAAKGGDRG
jgi:hypothetical protein